MLGIDKFDPSTTTKPRSDTIDLNDHSLKVDISDALSERERVKFTVHTKTTLSDFPKSDLSVVRQHEEFLWLHDVLVNNDLYSGYIIPPPPPKPNFDISRGKLQKLSDGEGTMTKEEFNKTKQELEAEYLATFKKTVAMHEIFLQRLATHSQFKNDNNFRIFLHYENDLSVRGKNKREKLVDIFNNLSKSADDIVLNNTQKDIDDFFVHEKIFLNEYYNHIRECTIRADNMTRSHKNVADSYIKVSSGLIQLAQIDSPSIESFYMKTADCFEKIRKIKSRSASDQDLKLSDTLRYYMRESLAAKDLLYRRTKCLASYESANRSLDIARRNNRDFAVAEGIQKEACSKFEKISKLAKQELADFKVRRVSTFRKNFIDFVELQIKHSKSQILLFKSVLSIIKLELDD